MKIRTVYFKVARLEEASRFWRALLDADPIKEFPEWQEFLVGDVRLGLLPFDQDQFTPGNSCIPVFEFPEGEIAARIERAKKLGASVVLEGEDHPDHPHPAAVLVDPTGNEFELTSFHD